MVVCFRNTKLMFIHFIDTLEKNVKIVHLTFTDLDPDFHQLLSPTASSCDNWQRKSPKILDSKVLYGKVCTATSVVHHLRLSQSAGS